MFGFFKSSSKSISNDEAAVLRSEEQLRLAQDLAKEGQQRRKTLAKVSQNNQKLKEVLTSVKRNKLDPNSINADFRQQEEMTDSLAFELELLVGGFSVADDGSVTPPVAQRQEEEELFEGPTLIEIEEEEEDEEIFVELPQPISFEIEEEEIVEAPKPRRTIFTFGGGN